LHTTKTPFSPEMFQKTQKLLVLSILRTTYSPSRTPSATRTTGWEPLG
jgi:hypothetical protein